MKIFLIGPMGSGKTHFGKKLAAHNNFQFYDLDNYIEENEQRSIPEIFSKHGEDHFRKIEQKYLHELLEKKNIVVATGGGTPCFFDNLKRMNEAGETIYLKTPVDVLVERLKNETSRRPLIENKNEKELKEFLEKQLNEREKYYRQAKITYGKINYSQKDFDDIWKK